MNTRSTARFVGLSLTMAAALAMSGCGGGSSKPADRPPTGFSSIDAAVTGDDQRSGIRAAAAMAAGNTPNAGGGSSVTQSSTDAADSLVEATVERAADGTISWTVGDANLEWSVNRDNARVLAEPRGEGWRGIQFHQAPDGGEGSGTGPGLYVNVYTDIEAPTTRPAATTGPVLGPAAGVLAPAAVAPAGTGCGVGDTVSPGESCSYTGGGAILGDTFTFTVDENGDACVARFCTGKDGILELGDLRARGTDGEFEILSLSSSIAILEGGIPAEPDDVTPPLAFDPSLRDPRQPPAIPVPGPAGVVFTGEVDYSAPLPFTRGTFNGVAGTFVCTSTFSSCGDETQNGRPVALRGTWEFYPRAPAAGDEPSEQPAAPVMMVTVQEADYLVGGIWMRVPEDAASVADYEFGAFMSGSDPFEQDNLAGLTGTATYTGGATAVYSYQPTNRNYFVDGEVRLTADFGDASSLGTIDGTISNITGEGPKPGWYEGGSVVLGTAQIGDADSGFFTGDTSTRSSDPDDPVLTGKWGGRFYGNGAAGAHPGSVAGTFGGATDDGSQSFVGIYGARRPAPSSEPSPPDMPPEPPPSQ